MNCAACSQLIASDEDFIQCTDKTCHKTYHSPCTGRQINNDTDTWICPECMCSRKKGGDNSSTPVGASKKAIIIRDPYVTRRKQLSATNSPLQSVADEVVAPEASLTLEMRYLRQEITSLKEQLKDALTTIAKYEMKLEGCISSMESFYAKFNRLETLSTVMHESSLERPSAVSCSSQMIVVEKTKEPKETFATMTKLKKAPHKEIVATFSTHPDDIAPRKTSGAPMNNLTVDSGTDMAKAPISDQRGHNAKPRRHTSLCGTAGPDVTTLKAVDPRKHIHLWNMESTADEIREYLRKLCPDGTCTVEELSPRGHYKSYKIGVPEACYDLCLSISVWPVNARIKQWIQYKRKPENQFNTRPFREANPENPRK